MQLALLLTLTLPAQAPAPKAPEVGYVYPPGGRAGTTVNVHLAGHDWTPDMDFFVLDPRVKLEVLGPPGEVLVPPPPYWFGPKGYIAPLPLPRERPARLTLPADLPPGPVRWRVANANGAAARAGVFWVGAEPEVFEEVTRPGPQKLPALPVTVSGRLARIEEVDRYRFAAAKDGPVTIELFAHRLGAEFHALLAVHDAAGRLVADAVDGEGQDLALTFAARAGAEYTVQLHDLDFRGDRSYVYRLALTPGPRVLAALPAAGRHGETRPVEFVGMGLATGQPLLESVTRSVTFPSDPKLNAFAYRLETPWGLAPACTLGMSDRPETVAAGAGPHRLTLPAAVTAALEQRPAEARYLLDGKKGDVWDVRVEARTLDPALSILGPDGKELVRNDDLPGMTDAGLSFTVPADGTYTLVVADQSGKAGTRAAVYRLTASRPAPDFQLQMDGLLNVALGGTAELNVTATRQGGYVGPINLTVAGLPEGVTAPAGLAIPAGQTAFKVKLQAAANAPTAAALVKVAGTGKVGMADVTRPALALVKSTALPFATAADQADAAMVAVMMKPRCVATPVEADGGRKVHRGSTHPAELLIERLEGFQGKVHLHMAAAQSYQRQGITGPELTVPAGAGKCFYPCFMPEWLETTRTSRMAVIAVVQVPDPRGKMRHLVTAGKGFITMSMEGNILKVTAGLAELDWKPGQEAAIPVKVVRSTKLPEAVKLELDAPPALAALLKAEVVTVPVGQAETVFRLRSSGPLPAGPHEVVIRGTALKDGKWPVVSEARITLEPMPR